MTENRRWWLIGVAALLAAIFLYQSVGPAGAAALAVVAIAVFGGYRVFKSRTSGGVRCLNCGESLPATARNCKYCGSARWTVQ